MLMARPPKKGIDYSGWSVTIFDNDTKMDKLLDAHGWIGFGVYFYLCQRAYGGEGYFYRWGYDDCASTSRKMGGGVSSGTVKEAVGYCLQIGLFDKGLFDRWGVLTSRGIQRRYWEVVKERDVRSVISDYWLLQDSECKGLTKTPLNTAFLDGNEGFTGGNEGFLDGNEGFCPIKESKVKERRANESKGKEKEVKKRKEESSPSLAIYFTNNEPLNRTFLDFIEMRKKIKKPMTDRAIELSVRKLEDLSKNAFGEMDEGMAIKILEQSIMNCWQGLFPLKEGQQTRNNVYDEWRNA
jgi:hypothetical protein